MKKYLCSLSARVLILLNSNKFYEFAVDKIIRSTMVIMTKKLPIIVPSIKITPLIFQYLKFLIFILSNIS